MKTTIKYCENFGDLSITQGNNTIVIDRNRVDDMLSIVKGLRNEPVDERESENEL